VAQHNAGTWPETAEQQIAVMKRIMPLLDGEDHEMVYRTLSVMAPPQGQDSSLREYFEAQEQRKLHTWKPTAQQLAEERQHLMGLTNAELHEQFANLARNSLLTATDAMVVPYLLSDSAEERRFFAALLMCKRGAERVRAHNFYVGSVRETAFMGQYGTRLMSFPMPLLPPSWPELNAVNIKLLAELSSTDGAGDLPQHATPVFRAPNPSDVIGGDYFAPIVHNAQGDAAVDLHEMQEFLAAMHGGIQRLRGRGSFAGHSGQQWRGGQGRGGRSGGRGRGYQYPRGGGDETTAAARASEQPQQQQHQPPAPQPSQQQPTKKDQNPSRGF
jgi:hypothetical protein